MLQSPKDRRKIILSVSQKSVTCGPPLREARAVNPFRTDLRFFSFVFRFYEIEKISICTNLAFLFEFVTILSKRIRSHFHGRFRYVLAVWSLTEKESSFAVDDPFLEGPDKLRITPQMFRKNHLDFEASVR